jgi:hypothetical protein
LYGAIDPAVLLYLIGFTACLFAMYVMVPLLLQRSSAVFLNLSLLSSDFWSILAAVLLFGASLHALYFVAFIIIIAGLLLYNLATSTRPIIDTCVTLCDSLVSTCSGVPRQPPSPPLLPAASTSSSSASAIPSSNRSYGGADDMNGRMDYSSLSTSMDQSPSSLRSPVKVVGPSSLSVIETVVPAS